MRRTLIVVSLLAVAAGLSCRRGPAPTPEVVALAAQALPSDPGDPAWQAAPEHVAKLLLQDLVEPRLMTPSTPEVRVRAIASANEVAFRLEWPDAVANDLPGAGRFPDGCAVQLPEKADANVPDPQMGQADKGVQITYWRADWQATVNGRGTTIQDLYPNATVDHYPFEAKSLEPGSDAQRQMVTRYAPAAGAGNLRGGARSSAVEDLRAVGPGSLTPAPATSSRGKGVRTRDGWSVVVTRAMPDGLSLQSRTQVAFAVWEGSANESGARKMRTGWVGLSMRGPQ
ncbi:MAG: ethylbenzene dehydrogenase-related protein [Acidobacteriota bacterium]|nr:ethylbenzene dehydrogenase-related protein [Acidobacteriota bacterium]